MGPAAWALIKYMNPSADIISQSTSVVDLTDATIGPGSAFNWAGDPVFIWRR